MRDVVVVMRSLYLRLEGFVLSLPVHRRHLFFLYVYVFFFSLFLPSFVSVCVCDCRARSQRDSLWRGRWSGQVVSHRVAVEELLCVCVCVSHRALRVISCVSVCARTVFFFLCVCSVWLWRVFN